MVLASKQAVAVLMLQPFAVQRRPPGGRAEQKSFCLAVARQPDQIADALEAEHRVVNVKRDHVDAEMRVSRARGDERRHRRRLR